MRDFGGVSLLRAHGVDLSRQRPNFGYFLSNSVIKV